MRRNEQKSTTQWLVTIVDARGSTVRVRRFLSAEQAQEHAAQALSRGFGARIEAPLKEGGADHA